MNYPIEAVFCDDIRREESGKLILVGVYPKALSVEEFPNTLELSLWVKINKSFQPPYSFKVEVIANEDILHTVEPTFTEDDGSGSAQVLMIGMPVKLMRPGHIGVTVSGEGGEIGQITLPVIEKKKSKG